MSEEFMNLILRIQEKKQANYNSRYCESEMLQVNTPHSFVTPWTVACQDPLSMGIPQERILGWDAMPSSSRGSSQPRD